jgi:hypothetical protein
MAEDIGKTPANCNPGKMGRASAGERLTLEDWPQAFIEHQTTKPERINS